MFNFRSIITIKLLDYYFTNPESKHYINELAVVLDVDPGNLFRKLRELENEGIFKSEMGGRQKYFFLNEDYHLLAELKKAFELKFGLVNALKNSLEKLVGLEEAYLYGSFSRGQAEDGSDVDLLLVGNHKSLDAVRVLNKVQKKFKREINIVNLSRKEFEKKKGEDFLKNIFDNHPIKII